MPSPGGPPSAEPPALSLDAPRSRATLSGAGAVRLPVALDRDLPGLARAMLGETAALEHDASLLDHRGVAAQEHVIARRIEAQPHAPFELPRLDQRRQTPSE